MQIENAVYKYYCYYHYFVKFGASATATVFMMIAKINDEIHHQSTLKLTLPSNQTDLMIKIDTVLIDLLKQVIQWLP